MTTHQLRHWGPAIFFDQLPELELTHDGLVLTVSPIAKKETARGKPGARPIGVQSSGGGLVTSRYAIRDKLKKKAGRYGELNQPYIVVVNCLGEMCDLEEIEKAVYGSEGLWRSRRPKSYSRLSAVIAFYHLVPYSISRSVVRVFHNPESAYPYKGILATLPQATLTNDSIAVIEGRHPRDWFGLAVAWPEES